MNEQAPILIVRGLSVDFQTRQGRLRAVDNIDLDLHPGEMLAVVGESGCGKSTLSRAIMGLHEQTPEAQVSGSIRLRGDELAGKTERDWCALRGDRLGMVFQDPMSSLNPVYRIGAQVAEVPCLHGGVDRRDAWRQAVESLGGVGIPSPAERADQYPYEFSGGMRQRVVIAMATIGSPDVLIADEPTTALDVTIQAQIMKLMLDMRQQTNCGILLITHDLAVVAQTCDRVMVMYAGRIAEQGPVKEVFKHPTHPYTRGLLATIPGDDPPDRLPAIPGQPPELKSLGAGCPFAPRCDLAQPHCGERHPPLEGTPDHQVACWEREVRDVQ